MRFFLPNVSILILIVNTWPFFAKEKYTLQFKMWHPFVIDNDFKYWCVYVQAALGLISTFGWSVIVDIIIAGFFMQVCAQFDLIALRLQSLPDVVKTVAAEENSSSIMRIHEQKIIKQIVHHHLGIIK